MIIVFKRPGLPLAMAVALAATSAAAHDDTTASQAGDAAVTAAAASATGTAKPARVTKYCAITKPAGSMLPRKICKTEQGWAEYGYTIEDLMQ